MRQRGRSGFHPRAPRQTGEPTLPLINVVFLLLIFVLLTSVIEADPPLPVDLPYSESAPAPVDEGELIFLSADGKQADFNAIFDADALDSWVAEYDPQIVAIRADKQVSVQTLFDLSNRLRDLGVERVEVVVLTP